MDKVTCLCVGLCISVALCIHVAKCACVVCVYLYAAQLIIVLYDASLSVSMWPSLMQLLRSWASNIRVVGSIPAVLISDCN